MQDAQLQGDTARHYASIDAADAAQDDLYRARAATVRYMLADLIDGKLLQAAAWAPHDKYLGRQPRLAEVWSEALDCCGAPDAGEIMMTMAQMANGGDKLRHAQELLTALAWAWADTYITEESA